MATEDLVVDVSRDWAMASGVQQRFMRGLGGPADALDYSAQCRQVRELGGDCYEFAHLEDQRVALTIGDASGKGLAAALMISNVQSSLRTAAIFTGNNVGAALTAVNRQAYASSLADRFATLFYGVFSTATRTLKYANAGHNPPMVIRPGRSTLWLEAGGPPVGLFPEWTYEEGTVHLGPGDLILAYTDGVIESVNPAGEEWGVEGLRKAAVKNDAQCAAGIVDAIFTALDEYSQGRQDDDATVAVLRLR